MKNKYLIALGGLTSVITPIAVISCSCSSKAKNDNGTEVNPPPVLEANKSPLTITNSNLIFDISATDKSQLILEESKKHDIDFQSIKWADNNYESEKEIIRNWYKDQVDKLNSIKVAFVSYHKGIKWTKVFRFDTELSRIKKLSPISTIYDLYLAAQIATLDVPIHLQNVIKKSTDISDYYDQSW